MKRILNLRTVKTALAKIDSRVARIEAEKERLLETKRFLEGQLPELPQAHPYAEGTLHIDGGASIWKPEPEPPKRKRGRPRKEQAANTLEPAKRKSFFTITGEAMAEHLVRAQDQLVEAVVEIAKREQQEATVRVGPFDFTPEEIERMAVDAPAECPWATGLHKHLPDGTCLAPRAQERRPDHEKHSKTQTPPETLCGAARGLPDRV